MAVPPGVVTAMGPLVAPAGTVAVIEVSDTKVKAVAAVPSNLTLPPVTTAPVKPVPVRVTEEPIAPLAGAKPVSVGTGEVVTVKEDGLAAVPDGVVTVIGPAVALALTNADWRLRGLAAASTALILHATLLTFSRPV